LRQIGAEMVQDSKATTWGGAAGCKIEAECKGVVRADGVSSLSDETPSALTRWLGSGKAKAQGRRMGWGAIACHLRHVLFRICLCISDFRLDKKGCWRTSILCTHIHEFLYILHFFHLFILLSYLIFDFVCLTLSLADTYGTAKYARTYLRRYTHTRTHKNKKHTKKIYIYNDNQQIRVTYFGENKKTAPWEFQTKALHLFLYE